MRFYASGAKLNASRVLAEAFCERPGRSCSFYESIFLISAHRSRVHRRFYRLASGALFIVLGDWSPPFDSCFIYYPSNRQNSLAFRVIVDALKYKSSTQSM